MDYSSISDDLTTQQGHRCSREREPPKSKHLFLRIFSRDVVQFLFVLLIPGTVVLEEVTSSSMKKPRLAPLVLGG